MGTKMIFGGIDGTGDFFTRDYEPTFANSHVNVLAQFWKEGPAHYRPIRSPVSVSPISQALSLSAASSEHTSSYLATGCQRSRRSTTVTR